MTEEKLGIKENGPITIFRGIGDAVVTVSWGLVCMLVATVGGTEKLQVLFSRIVPGAKYPASSGDSRVLIFRVFGKARLVVTLRLCGQATK